MVGNKGVGANFQKGLVRGKSVAMGIGRNPGLTKDRNPYSLTTLGSQAIVCCAVVVSRSLCAHREIEGCSFSTECRAVPQGDILIVELIQDTWRAPLGLTMKCHQVSLKGLGLAHA